MTELVDKVDFINYKVDGLNNKLKFQEKSINCSISIDGIGQRKISDEFFERSEVFARFGINSLGFVNSNFNEFKLTLSNDIYAKSPIYLICLGREAEKAFVIIFIRWLRLVKIK